MGLLAPEWFGWLSSRMARRRRSGRQSSRTPSAARRLRLEPLEERTLLAVGLVSVGIGGGSGQRASSNPSISNDGRYVLFESTANDLVLNDNNGTAIVDIFRRDTQTGAMQLVSINSSNSSGGNGSSSAAVMSADGRYVAFISTATDLQLATPDANGIVADVFLRDMVAGTTTVVSRSQTGGTANGPSAAPTISRDGRFVAFQSLSTNMITPGLDQNNASDVFVWDRTNAAVTALSVAFGNTSTGNGSSTNAVISGNGTIVAFISTASNLVTNDTNAAVADIFTRPVAGGSTQLITLSRTGGSGNNSSALPTISDDGRFIAFTSLASDLVINDNNAQQDVFVRDRTAAAPVLVSADSSNTGAANGPSASPVISRGGQFVAFTSTATNLTTNDTNGTIQDVFRRNLTANTTQLVSVQVTVAGSGNGTSSEPVISLDGRYVAFSSQASTLAINDTNGAVQDVFRRDMTASSTTLLSMNFTNTGSGSGASNDPSISDDGQAVVFASVANNLVNNDTNGAIQDIFRFTPSAAASNQIVVTAPDRGGGPHIRVFDANSLSPLYQFLAYNAGFTGGVRVATADVNADGVSDIITAAGPGGGPHVRVWNGAAPGTQLSGAIGSFFAYNTTFTGGVFVAAADIDRDGRADVITGADAGGGPHVRVFSGATGAIIREFFAYAGNFFGGVRVAAGDINADGFRDIITGSGAGIASNFTVFSGFDNSVLTSLAPYGAFGGGVYVSGGDLNGDGRADIITGAGQGGGPHVRGFSGVNNANLFSIFAYAQSFSGGVRVGTSDADSNGQVDVLVAAGPGIQSSLRVFNGQTGMLRTETTPYSGFFGGAFTAGSKTSTLGGSPLLAAPGESTGKAAPLDESALAPLIGAAIDSFAAAGLTGGSLAQLAAAPVRIADLPFDLLGFTLGNQVLIDIDAAGRGWYVDPTPGDVEPFDGIDLLTVIAHELGHVLGLQDLHGRLFPDDVLADTLGRGVRRLPTATTVDQVFGG